jgi:hypothetical protein
LRLPQPAGSLWVRALDIAITDRNLNELIATPGQKPGVFLVRSFQPKYSNTKYSNTKYSWPRIPCQMVMETNTTVGLFYRYFLAYRFG